MLGSTLKVIQTQMWYWNIDAEPTIFINFQTLLSRDLEF